jgi:hypothetical protein
MKPIRIDFAPPSWRRTLWKTPSTHLAALVIASLAIGAIGLDWVVQRRELGAAEQLALEARIQTERLAQKRPSAGERTLTATADARAQAQTAELRLIAERLNRPWSDALAAIERANGPVAMLELHLEPQVQRVRGTAEAKNPAAMLAYIDRLNRAAPLQSARLLRHEVNSQDPNHPIGFGFEARWPTENP